MRIAAEQGLDCRDAAMHLCSMTTVPMTKRGTITIPPEIRRNLGLDHMANPLLILEERDGGLFLQPASAVPVRNIPRETIEAWIREDEVDLQTLQAEKQD